MNLTFSLCVKASFSSNLLYKPQFYILSFFFFFFFFYRSTCTFSNRLVKVYVTGKALFILTVHRIFVKQFLAYSCWNHRIIFCQTDSLKATKASENQRTRITHDWSSPWNFSFGCFWFIDVLHNSFASEYYSSLSNDERTQNRFSRLILFLSF